MSSGEPEADCTTDGAGRWKDKSAAPLMRPRGRVSPIEGKERGEMVELVHEIPEQAEPPFRIYRQPHLADIPHAGVFSGNGWRVALFKGDDWEGCYAAAARWVERFTGRAG